MERKVFSKVKYIRTIDGIIKYNENEIIFKGRHYFITDGWSVSDYVYSEDEIVAQADTIEDLCDEFVVIGREVEENFITKCPKAYLKGNFEIYGAVWCEWGLKFVARMNSKGELELL